MPNRDGRLNVCSLPRKALWNFQQVIIQRLTPAVFRLVNGAEISYRRPEMICPKCNAESEGRFCRECGSDLEVYEQLAALRRDLETLRVQLSKIVADPSSKDSGAPVQNVSRPTEAAGSGMPPPLPTKYAKRKDVLHSSAEMALGQKWFLGIGVLILIIGIGFFLKYAFDQEWLGPAVQIAVGFVCGVSLLFLGGICHRRQLRGLDVGIGASGLGTLYLSSYAASQVHHLLPAWLSLALILIVTLIGACLSGLWISESLAVLTFLGAYLAPLLFASEQFDTWVFFGYLAVLALGGQFLAFANGWRVLYVIGAVLTWLALVNWTQMSYRRLWFIEAFIFTQLLFIAFSLMPFLRSVLKRESAWPLGFALAALNGLLCCWHSANLLDYQKIPSSLVSLGYSIVCLGMGLLISQRKPLISNWLVAQGLTFLLVFWAQIVSKQWIPVFWSAELVVLYWVAAKSDDRALLFGTTVVGFVVSLERVGYWIEYFSIPRQNLTFTSEWFSRWLAGLSVIASLLLVSWLDQAGRVRGIHPKFNRVFEALGIASLFGFLNLELLRVTSQFMRTIEVAALSVLWSLFAIGLMLFGIWFRRKGYRFSAIALLFATALKVLAYDTAEVSTPYRILSCMVLGAILVVVSFLYYRFSERLADK
jgi:uncharacterized membrane protein